MNIRSKTIALLALLGGVGPARADSPPPVPTKPAATSGELPADKRALMRRMRDEREKRVRERGGIFEKIAVKHDDAGEYVLYRDQDVTAFLDLKDPKHPRFSPDHDEDGAAAKGVSHVLVVPNQPRETIGKTVASDITVDDLEATLKVMRAAATLAPKFGFKNPKIYVKSPARVGVGYLHVNIVGERATGAYPPALK